MASKSNMCAGNIRGKRAADSKGKMGHKKQRKMNLFEEEEEEEVGNVSLNVNPAYAKRYDDWKRKEEREKLINRYGKDADESEESSSSEEDEAGDRLPADFDKNFFQALACLRKKDSKIYNKSHTFFSNEKISLEAKSKKKLDKPMYLHDYERDILLNHNGKTVDDEGESEAKKRVPTYNEELEELKISFKKNLEDSDDDEILTKKASNTQTSSEQKLLLTDAKTKEAIKNVWSGEQDEGELFLRDFILQQKHVSEDSKVPSYEQIVASESEEEFLMKQEGFEHKFDFRFEEPDQEFIKRYPRTIQQSYRIKDATRSVKRSEVKQRKQKEKVQKLNELKRLKALKRTEIMEKLEKIKMITGNTKVGFADVDLKEDFNPEEHDKRMQQIFDEEYYEEEEATEPELPFEEEVLQVDNWDEWTGEDGGDAQPHCEDPDFVMDCDYNPAAKQQPEKEKHGKKKRGSKFRKALLKKKPIFDPTDKSFEEYFDEYYKLDCEDIIGDIPCRFKYRTVMPNSFGLSVDEILIADNKELNKWCSLKKACQYRSEEEEKYDVKAYEKMGGNLKKKMNILRSLYKTEEDDEDRETPEEQVTEAVEVGTTDSSKSPKKKKTPQANQSPKSKAGKRKNKRKLSYTDTGSNAKKGTQSEIPDQRLKAYGINPKKFKNKLKYGKGKEAQ